MNIIKKKYILLRDDYKMLLRNVPSSSVTVFVVSVVLMNLLASRQWLNLSWVALDCGFFLSWFSFLAMDIITKRFGSDAAIKISAMALGVNLLTSLIFYVVTKIPGQWSAGYSNPEYMNVINAGIDETFGGTWFVLLGSTIAMFVASVVNSVTNETIGRRLKGDSFKHFAIRSYISTALGQFVDNLVFAFIVSHTFFGWTTLQCITCAVTGALLELIGEVIFSPIGYRVSVGWEKENVGQAYIDYIKKRNR